MHHPTDVAAALLNGGVVLFVAARLCLTDRGPVHTVARAGGGSDSDDPGAAGRPGADTSAVSSASATDSGRRVTVVVNPLVTDRATREGVRRRLERSGHHRPEFVETTATDPGGQAAARAVRDGAGLLVACGGDGTVTACAGALAGTSVPLLVVPCGTGNLLARNLGLPRHPGRALDEGLAAPVWSADLLLAGGDGLPDTCVTAMAGAGLDAEIIAGTGRRLKNLIGWPAYAVAALRHLGSPRLRLTVTLDGGAPLERRARMVLVGNVGAIQGGLRLLPDARPDNGLLQLALFDPRGPVDWLRALRLLGPGGPATAAVEHTGSATAAAHPLEYLQARRVELEFDRPVRRELDGEAVPAGRTLRLTVRPGALLLRAPRPATSDDDHPSARPVRPRSGPARPTRPTPPASIAGTTGTGAAVAPVAAPVTPATPAGVAPYGERSR